jgi:LEA14-like dessication related protein
LARETAKKLETKTVVKCNDIEVLEGDLNSPLWVMVTPEEKLKVVMDIEEYMSMMEALKQAMKENIDLKLEKAILSEFPIDYEDVRAVVLEEMKNSDENIQEIVKKVKTQHPNLFYNLEIDKLF